jgi:hypothetical protein
VYDSDNVLLYTITYTIQFGYVRKAFSYAVTCVLLCFCAISPLNQKSRTVLVGHLKSNFFIICPIVLF